MSNEIKEEIGNLNDMVKEIYSKKDILITHESYMLKNPNSIKPSLCKICYNILCNMDFYIKDWYSKNPNSKSIYLGFMQEEFDEMYVMAFKANCLGFGLYTNGKNGINDLNSDELDLVYEVIQGLFDKYFEILLDRNLKVNNNTGMDNFLKLVASFEERMGLSDEEALKFFNKALEKGINITKCKTVEEIEEIYKDFEIEN